jgi:kynurenine formamidase
VKLLKGVDVAGKAVLLCTGWDIYWGTDGYAHYPFLGRDAAEYLRDSGAKLVGVDYLAIDSQRFRYVLMRLARNRESPIWLLIVFPVGLNEAMLFEPCQQLRIAGFSNHEPTIDPTRAFPSFQRGRGFDRE